MSRGKQTSIDQDRAIKRLSAEGYGAAAIYRKMEGMSLLDEPHPSISLSTVQRRVRDLASYDTSEPWSAMEADPDEARLVLDVVADIFDRTEGRVWLTKDLAARIAQIRRMAPDVTSPYAYALAKSYQSAGDGTDTRPLDLVLGEKLWVGGLGEDRWFEAYHRAESVPGWRELAETFFAYIEQDLMQERSSDEPGHSLTAGLLDDSTD